MRNGFFYYEFPGEDYPQQQNSGYSFGNIEKFHGYLHNFEFSKF